MKKFFPILLTIFLSITSFLTVSNYHQLENYKYNIHYLKYQIDYDHIIYMYSLIDEIDSEYEMLSIEFDENIGLYEQNQIKNYFKECIDQTKYLEEDVNVSYIIYKDKKDVISKGDTKVFDEDNSLVYSYINFNDDIICSGDFCSEYSNFNGNNFVDNFYLHTINWDGKQSLQLFSITLPIENIKINIPQGYEIYFKVNNTITPDGMIYHYLDSMDSYLYYFILVIAIALSCMFIFFLFVPIHVLENIHPYKVIKNWLFEFNLFFFGSILIAAGAGLLMLIKWTMDGLITYHLNIHSYIIDIFNFICWFIFYFICTVLPFLIKYIFKEGFINYFKNHTLVGLCVMKLKSTIHELMNINLKNSLIIKIGCILVINSILVFILQILCNNRSFEYVLFIIIIYTCILFIPSLLMIDKLYKQYQILLDKTKLLSEGQFDLKIDENVGLFNDYKNELLQVKDGFEKAVQEEIKATNLRTELITNVSHDLKTPITCIKNYVTLLKDETIEEDKKKEYINNIHSYTNRLARLVDDLFEVSKVSSGNISLDLVDLDLVDLVKQVLAENNDILKNRQLTVISKFDVNHIPVSLDSNKTYRIFENLIINISKYALEHTRVYVHVYESNEGGVVEFKNISRDVMNFTEEAITERFVRADSSRNTEGSGLGLAIVKSYSELQNIDFKITIDGDLFKTTLTFKKSS